MSIIIPIVFEILFWKYLAGNLPLPIDFAFAGAFGCLGLMLGLLTDLLILLIVKCCQPKSASD